MKMKCSGCGAEYDETEIRFCRRDMGSHVCGSLIFPSEVAAESKEIKAKPSAAAKLAETKEGE